MATTRSAQQACGMYTVVTVVLLWAASSVVVGTLWGALRWDPRRPVPVDEWARAGGAVTVPAQRAAADAAPAQGDRLLSA
jgi:hypothetical protein